MSCAEEMKAELFIRGPIKAKIRSETRLDISKLVHRELKQNSLFLVAHINGAYVDWVQCMSCVLKNWFLSSDFVAHRL